MTTNNHPAHGPVSLERLHQIRQYIERNNQYQNGGNRAYILADMLKVIDGAIAVAGMDPYGYVHKDIYESCGTAGLSNDRDAYRNSDTHIALYTAPPEPVLPEEMYWQDAPVEGSTRAAAYATGWNACRAAMLQAGNSPVIGWLRSDYNSDNKPDPNSPLFMLGSNDPSEMWGVKYIPLSGNSRLITDGWVIVPEEPTHEMLEAGDEQFGTYDVYRRMIEAAPQQEVKGE